MAEFLKNKDKDKNTKSRQEKILHTRKLHVNYRNTNFSSETD